MAAERDVQAVPSRATAAPVVKHWRSDQDRNGSARRRRLEFEAITDQIKRRKAAFVERLKRRLEQVGHCLVYKGTLDHKGYARFNVRYKGKHVSIGAHRAFLILQLGRPIRRGYEAGHSEICEHRACVAHLREEHYRTNAVTAR